MRIYTSTDRDITYEAVLKSSNPSKDDLIFYHLYKDYNRLTREGKEVLGIFLQGSQNYELDYEGSDIDTKAMIVPTFEDLVLNKQQISTTYVNDDNSHLDVKDFRLMLDCFRKQNVNFIEILFTKYAILNPKYFIFWNKLVENREKIAHYNNYAALNCAVGCICEKYAALHHPYESKRELIEKYGYDSKQLHHMIRLEEFIRRMFVEKESYGDCLISNNKEELIRIKADNSYYSNDEAEALAVSIKNRMVEYKQIYMAENPVVVDKDVDELFYEFTKKVIAKYFSQVQFDKIAVDK